MHACVPQLKDYGFNNESVVIVALSRINIDVKCSCSQWNIWKLCTFIYMLACSFLGRQFISLCTTSVTGKTLTKNDEMGKNTREQTSSYYHFNFRRFCFFSVLLSRRARCGKKFHGSSELSYISNNSSRAQREKTTTDFCKLSMEWSFILINLSPARFWRSENSLFFCEKTQKVDEIGERERESDGNGDWLNVTMIIPNKVDAKRASERTN